MKVLEKNYVLTYTKINQVIYLRNNVSQCEKLYAVKICRKV